MLSLGLHKSIVYAGPWSQMFNMAVEEQEQRRQLWVLGMVFISHVKFPYSQQTSHLGSFFWGVWSVNEFKSSL